MCFCKLVAIRDKLPLSRLKDLYIEGNTRSGDDQPISQIPVLLTQIFSNAKALTSLTLYKIKGLDLTLLGNMPDITSLNMFYCGLNNKACRDLALFVPQLRVLQLGLNRDISVEGIVELSRTLTELQELNVQDTNVDVGISQVLSKRECFPYLRTLCLCVQTVSAEEKKVLQAIRQNLSIELM